MHCWRAASRAARLCWRDGKAIAVIASQRVRAKRGPMTGSAKQSRATRAALDCFVASLLAMTELRPRPTTSARDHGSRDCAEGRDDERAENDEADGTTATSRSA